MLRTNALPVTTYPTLCRKVVCKIGGVKEVREAVEKVGADAVAVKRNVGVLAFGSDAEVRRAFNSFGITEYDVHTIEARRLRFESMELGLLYDALSRAIKRERPVEVTRSAGHYVIAVDPTRANEEIFKSLRKATNTVTGTVPQTQLRWAEAAWIKLEYWLDRLWLLIEPTVRVERTEDDDLFARSREFIRARLAGRYNSKWNELVEVWAHIITGGSPETTLKTFGIADGVDASFTISALTAYSRRET